MNLHTAIKNDYINAMREGNKETKGVLSMVIPRLNAIMKEKGVDTVSDEEVMSAIRAEIKQVNQSIEGAKAAGREDQEAKYLYDLSILEIYLPKQATDEEVEAVVQSTLNDLDTQNFGEIMREASARLGNAADNKRISTAIKKLK